MINVVTINNCFQWKDTSGEDIHAHGGGFLHENGYYYLFGENRLEGVKVSCYRSSNLKNWEFRNHVLTLNSTAKSVYYRTDLNLNPLQTQDGALIERPKVLYNENTSQYIMWMHWENGRDYEQARCAVATCDTIDGDYIYRGSFNPIGHRSRDCTLFKDDDGTAYFISASRNNADLHIYRLSDDYLSIDEQVKTLWPAQYREAPAIMKRNGVYFLISSFCTGWYPNQGAYAVSDCLTGRWSSLRALGDATTFDSQPTYIIPVAGSETTDYLYIGDRWDPSEYHESTYIMLPLTFTNNKEITLQWADQITVDTITGHCAYMEAYQDIPQWRIKSYSTELFLSLDDGMLIGEKLSYKADKEKWIVESDQDDYITIKSSLENLYVSVDIEAQGEEVPVLLSKRSSNRCCEWRVLDIEEDQVKIINRSTSKALSVKKVGDRIVFVLTAYDPDYDPRQGQDRQQFLMCMVRS